MPGFTVKVKWGQESYDKIEINTDEEPMLFKAQLFTLTGVQPHRQKVMLKGALLKDDPTGWNSLKPKLKNDVTLLMMGTKDKDALVAVKESEKPKFVEDMDESEVLSAMDIPPGLTNLGNTCYLNATIQCLKTVPELKESIMNYKRSDDTDGVGDAATQLTEATRELFENMLIHGAYFTPAILLSVLRNAFPRFAEAGKDGYKQQDANECWVELLGMYKQKLMSKPTDKHFSTSVVDQYFGLVFETETKCVETEEQVVKSTEQFLQYSCYIGKEVKYLANGLKNRLQENITKKSSILDRDAEYVKTLKVCRLPRYLTIQMMRFQYKQKDAVNAKILKDVKFPLVLDVFDLCSEDLQQKLLPMRTKFKEHEDRAAEKAGELKSKGSKEEALKKDRDLAEASPELLEQSYFEDDAGSNNSGFYELQAVLTHKGRSSDSGHYVAWVRSQGETWFECNDDTVTPIHVEDVMKLSGGGDWHSAYILLYGPRKLMKYIKQESAEYIENEMD